MSGITFTKCKNIHRLFHKCFLFVHPRKSPRLRSPTLPTPAYPPSKCGVHVGRSWTIASHIKTMIFGKRQLYPYWRFMCYRHLHHVLMRHYESHSFAENQCFACALFTVLCRLKHTRLWWSEKVKTNTETTTNMPKSRMYYFRTAENPKYFNLYGKPILCCGF